MNAPSAIFAASVAAHAAVRFWPAKSKKRPAEDMRAFLFRAFDVSVIGVFNIVLPCLALFTSWLSRFDYSAPAAFHWLSIPVFADSIWTFWLVHSGVAAMINRKEGHARAHHSKFASLWIWTVGQSLCVHNCLGGVGSLAAFGMLCFARLFRQERARPAILVNTFSSAPRVPAYLE